MPPDVLPRPVLIVDDDPPTQKLLLALLQRYGFKGEVASNGAEAIDAIRSRDYSAVVLDVMMPAVGGHAVVEFLAASGSSLPVVICSAAGPAALGNFDSTVVKAIVRKPFDVDELMSIVRNVIGRDGQ